MTRKAVQLWLSVLVLSLLAPAAGASTTHRTGDLSPAPPPAPPYRPLGDEIDLAVPGAEAHLLTFPDGRYLVLERTASDQRFTAQFRSSTGDPLGETFAAGSAVATPPGLAVLAGDRWALGWLERECDSCPAEPHLAIYDGGMEVFTRRIFDYPEEFPIDGEVERAPILASNGVNRLLYGFGIVNGEEFAERFGKDMVVFLTDFDGTSLDRTGLVDDLDGDAWDGDQVLTGLAFVQESEWLALWDAEEADSENRDVRYRRYGVNGFSNIFPLGDVLNIHDPAEASTGERLGGGSAGDQHGGAVSTVPEGVLITWIDEGRALPTAPHGGILARVFDTQFESWNLEPIEILVTAMAPGLDYGSLSATEVPSLAFAIQWAARCTEAETDCDLQTDTGRGDRSREGVYARVFSRDRSSTFAPGIVESGPFQVPVSTVDLQASPRIQYLEGQGLLSTWVSLREPEAAPVPTARRVDFRPCEDSCLLLDGRFEVRVHWRDFQRNEGAGNPTLRDDDWGTFWFFRPENVELAVKVLDGTALTDHYWLFFASLTNVSYTVDVVDRATGSSRRYRNRSGEFGSRGDTLALPLNGPPSPYLQPEPGAVSGSVRSPAWESWRESSLDSWVGSTGPSLAIAEAARTASRRQAPVVAPVPTPSTPALLNAPATAPVSLPPCTEDEFCLQGDRFQVEIEWRDFADRRGVGTGQTFSSDSAWFWFFREGNPEVLVKILDGGGTNDYWWVFYGALSNVEFDLTVTDRATGTVVDYSSPLGSFAAAGDTRAFRQEE